MNQTHITKPGLQMKWKYHSYAYCEWISHLHFSHQLKNIAKKKKKQQNFIK